MTYNFCNCSVQILLVSCRVGVHQKNRRVWNIGKEGGFRGDEVKKGNSRGENGAGVECDVVGSVSWSGGNNSKGPLGEDIDIDVGADSGGSRVGVGHGDS